MPMILNYLATNPLYTSSEIRNIKTLRNTHEGYGDKAVGRVQLKREDGAPLCTVMARVTPEHRIHFRGYQVEVILHEEYEEIISCKCYDCVVSEGGCKHTVALLFWLHRRSEEPSLTSVACYWNVSKLSKVGNEAAVPLGTLLNVHVTALPNRNEEFRNQYFNKAKQCGSKSLLAQLQTENIIQRVSLHCLSIRYKEQLQGAKAVPEEFKQFCMREISDKLCNEVEDVTRGQYKCSSWYDARYGRITASKAYEVSRCNTKMVH